jgi:Flp pilus assembly pilin Flp
MEGFRTGLLKAYLRAFTSDRGQGFVEYLMIMGLVALGLAAALIAFQGQLSNALSTVGVSL